MRLANSELIDESYQQLATSSEEKSIKNGKSILIQAVRDVRDVIYAAVREQLSDESRTYATIADSVDISLASVQSIPNEFQGFFSVVIPDTPPDRNGGICCANP